MRKVQKTIKKSTFKSTKSYFKKEMLTGYIFDDSKINALVNHL